MSLPVHLCSEEKIAFFSKGFELVLKKPTKTKHIDNASQLLQMMNPFNMSIGISHRFVCNFFPYFAQVCS